MFAARFGLDLRHVCAMLQDVTQSESEYNESK